MIDPQQLLITLADAEAGHTGRHITVVGELDLSTSNALIDQVSALVDGGATLVVLDLSGASFIDSSGLRALIGLGQLLESTGGRLVIDGMSPAAQKLLEITGLLEQFRP